MDVQARIKELYDLMEYHNDRYYNEDDPELDDYQYDQLSLELRKLEKEYPEFVRTDSPTKKVGGSTKRELKKVKHDVPVISLQDVFSKEEVLQFVQRESVYENALAIKTIPEEIPEKLSYLEVRGEVYMSTDSFNRANEKQLLTGGKLYQNRRNSAAGTMRQLDSQVVRERDLDIFVFNLEISEGKEFESHSASLQWLAE